MKSSTAKASTVKGSTAIKPAACIKFPAHKVPYSLRVRQKEDDGTILLGRGLIDFLREQEDSAKILLRQALLSYIWKSLRS